MVNFYTHDKARAGLVVDRVWVTKGTPRQ